MPLYSIENKYICFIHIPKCAGSYIENLLEKKLGTPLLYSKFQPEVLLTVPQHLTYREICSLNFQENDFAYQFCIVRDPYERIESEFFYQKRVYKIKYNKINFSKWLIKSLKEAVKNPHYMKSHFRPQTDFLGENTNFFKLESDLQKSLEELSNICGGLDFSDEKVNASSREQLVWSKRALQVFNSFYTADFENLGYQPK